MNELEEAERLSRLLDVIHDRRRARQRRITIWYWVMIALILFILAAPILIVFVAQLGRRP